MQSWQVVSFIALSLGVALSLDVAVFTLLKFKSQLLSSRNWVLPITAYHMILFAGAYLGLSVFGDISTSIISLIGLLGSLLIGWIIYEAICAGLGKEPVFSLTEFANKHCNRGGVVWLIPEVLAVSWDALLSSPGMFPALQSFTNHELVLGWLIFGLTVALSTSLALLGALWLRRLHFHSVRKLTLVMLFARWLQLSILGGFAVNSLWYSLYFLQITTISPGESESLIIGLALITCLFIFLWYELEEKEQQIARSAIRKFN